MGGTGALWRPVGAVLEDRFEVLAPDQRGHGGSRPAAGGFAPLDYGRDVVETMEWLGFHPAWLVGHSMGVRTACAAAHLRPDLLCGLVLVDLGFTGAAGGGLGDGLQQFLAVLPMEFDSRDAARAFMAENCPDPSIAQYLMAVSVREESGKLGFPFDRDSLLATLEAARDAEMGPWVRELGERGMPILVLRGERSLVWTREEYLAEKARFADLPSVEFREFAGAGHGLPFEKRPEFVAAIESWFSR
jgi:pimeloyl-ACP methyl ester carboxylesterase